MADEIIIRHASVEDAELIADLSRKTFYDTFAVSNTAEDMDKFMREKFTREKLVEEVGQPGNIFLLAYHGGEVAGYARLRYSEKPDALADLRVIEIARIYAVSNMVGRGIGRALMEQCIEIASGQDNDAVWLGVWEKNKKAIDFYTRWGFEKFGEHEFVLGNDVQTDWLMRKML